MSVAALGLLSSFAEKQPLVCLVDDAQGLDRASAQVLGFALIPVGLVFIPGGTHAAGWIVYGTITQPVFLGGLPLPAIP